MRKEPPDPLQGVGKLKMRAFGAPVNWRGLLPRACHRRFFLPHSSSSSRFTAGAFAFFILSQ
jgi:hypothetical protein